MDSTDGITPDEAQKLLDSPEELKPADVRQLLRFMKHANDDLINKIRQLRSEIGRVSRR